MVFLAFSETFLDDFLQGGIFAEVGAIFILILINLRLFKLFTVLKISSLWYLKPVAIAEDGVIRVSSLLSMFPALHLSLRLFGRAELISVLSLASRSERFSSLLKADRLAEIMPFTSFIL